ncbi:MAG: hypothetical protein JXA25_02580 [Anaerolineales bacterium]|nr:hypothetical protein [Anaerolineales bacterium]
MNIAIDARIVCETGVCGSVSCVIINPVNNELTHVVVDDAVYPYTRYVIPTSLLEETESNVLRMKGTKKDFSKLEHFIEHRFIKSDEAHGFYPASRHVYLPFGWPIHEEFAKLEVEHIPQGELAIHRGATVEAVDGPIGKVDQFLVLPPNGHITHLIMLENHRWGNSRVTIPISAIDHTAKDVVYLKLNKAEIKTLPDIPIKHK